MKPTVEEIVKGLQLALSTIDMAAMMTGEPNMKRLFQDHAGTVRDLLARMKDPTP